MDGENNPAQTSGYPHGSAVAGNSQNTDEPNLQEMMRLMLLQQQTMQSQLQQQMLLIEQSHTREEELKKALETAKSTSASTKAENPKRPTIEYGAKDHEWEVFLDSWER